MILPVVRCLSAKILTTNVLADIANRHYEIFRCCYLKYVILNLAFMSAQIDRHSRIKLARTKYATGGTLCWPINS